ncbi:uncharacterized protein RAG0_01458 [Rhynchosporium agropyri]|uniref:Uncharacterized protein n=1 Tax=Rhynchosporium agropyri TaxID=914238 RepID=A0A1E1K1E1_9HELO|nr:uncharacterized protein RAG0_01458 [Rhynchosporium agropyri]
MEPKIKDGELLASRISPIELPPSLLAQRERQSHNYRSRRKDLDDQNIPITPRTVQMPSTNPLASGPRNVAEELGLISSSMLQLGVKVPKSARVQCKRVEVVKENRKKRSRCAASMAARFRNPS